MWLLNVMEVFSVGRGALLDIRCMSSKECVWCASDTITSVHIEDASIRFVCFCVCGKLSPHLRV